MEFERARAKTEELITRVINGETVKKVATELFNSVPMFYWNLERHKELSTLYTQSRHVRADVLADEILEIADNDMDAQRARNRIEARKWLASKMMPATYGDRIDVNVSQTLSISAALAEARTRVLKFAPGPLIDGEIVRDELEDKGNDIFD